jgi:hypothetical protein
VRLGGSWLWLWQAHRRLVAFQQQADLLPERGDLCLQRSLAVAPCLQGGSEHQGHVGGRHVRYGARSAGVHNALCPLWRSGG